MDTELERSLARELDDVARAVQVPPVPAWSRTTIPDQRRRVRHLPPLLAAAAVLLVAGVLAVALHVGTGSAPQPAAPTTPTSLPSSGPAPSEPAPSDPAPSDPAPSDAAPSDPARSREPAPPTMTDTTTFSAEDALDLMIAAVITGDRGQLLDPDAVSPADWQQLKDFAAGQGGEGAGCRDNGLGTRDCEISFDAAPGTAYYVILEPSEGGYGWRVGYVGIGGA